MQAEYPKKIPPTYWDTVHVQPRVRKFPGTGDSIETTSRKWRAPPEVLQDLKSVLPEVTLHDRDYSVTNQLMRSQTSEDFMYKAPQRYRFNKHTALDKNKYIYPPYRRSSTEREAYSRPDYQWPTHIDQPPLCNVHGTSEMRSAYKKPILPPTLVTDKDQHKHPASLPPDPPMVEPSWHKDLEPLDTTHEGYEKYLDPYLTTSRLHHHPYTAEQLSRISVTKDIVTYHTMSKEPWAMADSTTDNVNNISDAMNDVAAPYAPETPSISQILDDIWPLYIPVISEPKILPADPVLAQQGTQLQKFNGDGWRQVRYAETKRQFESTAPFCALKVNQYLESLVPKCKSFEVLQKLDQTLAAITHGLLKQQQLMQDALDSLPEAIKDAAVNVFTSPDSKYKKFSDDLLQYTCGRRAQVIQQRREMFKPRNMGVRQALYAIPPSDTYLFAEPRLTELVEALPNRVDHFAPNTSKCKCCHVHKLRRTRQQQSESEEDDSHLWKKKRRQ